MLIIALQTSTGPWVTGAECVKRDSNGVPIIARTPSGALHIDFVLLSDAS